MKYGRTSQLGRKGKVHQGKEQQGQRQRDGNLRGTSGEIAEFGVMRAEEMHGNLKWVEVDIREKHGDQ